MRGRGLKQDSEVMVLGKGRVAPYAGAWIETPSCRRRSARYSSPPMRGRGLKLRDDTLDAPALWSPPMRGRGLKLVVWYVIVFLDASPPMRGRGLKRFGTKK